jgi:hypothetical protein
VHEYADGTRKRKTTVYVPEALDRKIRVFAALQNLTKTQAMERLLSEALAAYDDELP